ncbi:hypothetical protein QE435_003266 [Rhizobium sp. SORGH_AS 787]|nr:hypothetical protein [Rhizobium sp. SORGH_AS_0787]
MPKKGFLDKEAQTSVTGADFTALGIVQAASGLVTDNAP